MIKAFHEHSWQQKWDYASPPALIPDTFICAYCCITEVRAYKTSDLEAENW